MSQNSEAYLLFCDDGAISPRLLQLQAMRRLHGGILHVLILTECRRG